MIQAGNIVLFRFPKTNQSRGKLRPALILRKLPGLYDDWLICMISTQLSQQIDGLDEQSIFVGSIGGISPERLSRIKTSLANWINS